MLSDPDSFAVSRNIIDPRHFDARLRAAVRYTLEYSDKYRASPVPEQVKSATGVEVDRFSDVQPQHAQWFLENIEQFARYKALELAVMEGVDLLQQDRGAEVEQMVKEAMTISLMKDLGTDYFRDPLARLERMKDRSQYISTGWKTLDDKLYGGFTRGALNVWAGGSGSGKSLFLQNIALNWQAMGLHVIYFSLELSEDLVSMRLDAMVSGYATKQIFNNINDVALKIRGRGLNTKGSLIIKKLAEAGTTANDLRAFVKEYEIKTGRRPDAIIVDYLDLMHPNNKKINPSDLFVKDKYTSEEMRALAGEYNLLCATASQLNRASVEAQEFDHSHIAGGISKINTADNVFGIFTSQAMRERGEYQIQFLKTRSSSAVGQKMELKFCPISMLITDKDEYEEEVRPKNAAELREDMKEKLAAREEVKEAAKGPADDEVRVSAARKDINSLMAHIRKRDL